MGPTRKGEEITGKKPPEILGVILLCEFPQMFPNLPDSGKDIGMEETGALRKRKSLFLLSKNNVSTQGHQLTYQVSFLISQRGKVEFSQTPQQGLVWLGGFDFWLI